MNLSDVLFQRRSTEHLRAVRAMFALIIVNFFDVFCQVAQRYFFSTVRALFLDSGVDPLHVLRKLTRPYLLLALWALSCVAHVSFPDMEVYARRVDHLVAIAALLLWPMDAFGVP